MFWDLHTILFLHYFEMLNILYLKQIFLKKLRARKMDLEHLKSILNLGHLNLPKLQIDRTPNGDDFTTKLYRQYSDYIDHENKGKEILEELVKDSRVQALNGCMISSEFFSSRFEIKNLAMWYAWAINEYGDRAARKNLEKFLESEMVPVINVLWVLGIELDSSIVLDDGIEIVPINEMQDSREKDEFYNLEFQSLSSYEPKPKAAIVIRNEVLKSSRSDTSFETPEEDRPFQESTQVLNDVALLLNAVEGVSCSPFCNVSYTMHDMPLGMFGGASRGYSRHDVIGNSRSKLSGNRLNEINVLQASFNKLSVKNKKRIRRVLSRLSQAKRREQIEDKILDLCIALEMTLLNNDKKKVRCH